MILLKKILIIRFSSIGDIVLTTPIIRAVDEQTDYEIHVLTKTSYKGLYEANPRIHKVHSFIKSTSECLIDLQKEGFDTIVDLQKNMRSHKLKKKLKVPSYSFPKLNIEKWLLVNFKINKLPKIHIVDRYFKAVSNIGVKNDDKGLEYYIPADDEVAPESIDLRLKEPFISIVIGGQHKTKILPPEKIAQIISGIKMPVVLLGGKEDIKRGEEIVKLAPNSDIIATCGEMNLNQSASLLRSSEVVITNDTGLMHIAAALNKNIISIWGNTVPEFGMYPYMPENKDKFIISEVSALRCRPCSKLGHQKCPKKHFRCMMDQDTKAIIEKVKDFMPKT